MNRMSRAGRKGQIRKVLMQEWKRKQSPFMTVGSIARRMGLKSSTYLKKLLYEMIVEDECIWMDTNSDVHKFGYHPLVQIKLPDRFITINGKSHKVANWALSGQEQ